MGSWSSGLDKFPWEISLEPSSESGLAEKFTGSVTGAAGLWAEVFEVP